MPKKLLYLLLIFCFINPLFSQTYFYKDDKGKIRTISHDEKASKTLDIRTYKFDSKFIPIKVNREPKIIYTKNFESLTESSAFDSKYWWRTELESEYEFEIFQTYENGQIKSRGKAIKTKGVGTNLNYPDNKQRIGRLVCNRLAVCKDIIVRTGQWNIWWPNGNLKHTYFLNGVFQDGIGKSYHENGSISFKGNFINGRYEGIHYKFYPSGYVKSKSEFFYDEVKDIVSRDKIDYSETDQQIAIGKNLERALSLVTEKHNSKFGDKAKEITVLSKDNLVSVKNSEGYYEGNYTSFVFQADYTELKSGYETYIDWATINAKAESIYRALKYYPTDGWYEDRKREHSYTVKYTDREVNSSLEYLVKCSSGKCEIIK